MGDIRSGLEIRSIHGEAEVGDVRGEEVVADTRNGIHGVSVHCRLKDRVEGA